MTIPKRILAVDFGDVRTGLAATDWTGSIVVPLERIDARDAAAVVQAIAAVVADRDTEAIALGMPVSHDGRPNQRLQRTEAFRQLLVTRVRCPVHAVDESHTTDEAHERLKQGGLKAAQRKKLADSVAAMVILERFRDQLRRQR